MTEPEERGAPVVRDEINQKQDELFNYNQKVVAVLRQQANDYLSLAALYEQQKQRAIKLAELVVELASISSEMTGDILIAEYGLQLDDSDDDEDEDEDDD